MPRTLSEQEFDAIKARVLASLPDGLSEAEFNRVVGPRMEQAIGEAENSNAPVVGGAVSRFLTNAGQMLNPVTIAQGIGHAVAHPVQTSGAIIDANLAELRKANEARKAGRWWEAGGHGMAGVIPMLGPMAANAGEQIASGDVAGGLGKSAGLIAPFGIKPGAQALGRVAGRTVQAARSTAQGSAALDAVAQLADDAATRRIVETAAPMVGPNKTRFGKKLAEIAPQLAREENMSALSREGLHAKIQAGLENATTALDDAAAARLASQQVATKPIVAALDAEIAKLTSAPVDASKYQPRATVTGTSTGTSFSLNPTPQVRTVAGNSGPYGQAVVAQPNAAQVATLKQIRTEIAQLGEQAPYEAVRRIRQAWDQVAKVKYLPSTGADALKSQAQATAAMRGTGAIRDALAATDPTTAAANAKYALYKSADDVLSAAAESELTRPKVGRGLMRTGAGAVAGAVNGGAAGAGVGAVVGGLVNRAAELAPTLKIVMARRLATVADLLRTGKVAEATLAAEEARSWLKTATKVGARSVPAVGTATNPTESQNRTTAPAW